MVRFEQDSALDTYSAKMTAAHARAARALGDGNFSEGVRRAIEFALAAKEREKEAQD